MIKHLWICEGHDYPCLCLPLSDCLSSGAHVLVLADGADMGTQSPESHEVSGGSFKMRKEETLKVQFCDGLND